MKFKLILAYIVAFGILSCGTKVTKNEPPKTQDVMKVFDYTSQINTNKTLKKDKKEGVLMDTSGLKEIGSFQLTSYFDERKKELVHIQNIEITDKKVLESYYFKKNKLFCIQVTDPYEEDVKIGENVRMMLILPNNPNKSERVQLFLEKAERFHNEFKSQSK